MNHPRRNLTSTVSKILLTVFFISFGFVMGIVYQRKLEAKNECGVSKHEYTVFIEKKRFKPAKVKAKRCNKLIFANKDSKLHSVVFGTHDNHVPYGDFVQEYLLPKERVSLKLFQAGTYLFHDHLHEEIKGQIIVDSN